MMVLTKARIDRTDCELVSMYYIINSTKKDRHYDRE